MAISSRNVAVCNGATFWPIAIPHYAFLTQAMVDDGIGLRDMGLIVSILLAQLFIFLGTFSMGLVGSWVSLYMSTRININILNDYLTKLLRLPMIFFEPRVSETISSVLEIMDAFRALLLTTHYKRSFPSSPLHSILLLLVGIVQSFCVYIYC